MKAQTQADSAGAGFLPNQTQSTIKETPND